MFNVSGHKKKYLFHFSRQLGPCFCCTKCKSLPETANAVLIWLIINQLANVMLVELLGTQTGVEKNGKMLMLAAFSINE